MNTQGHKNYIYWQVEIYSGKLWLAKDEFLSDTVASVFTDCGSYLDGNQGGGRLYWACSLFTGTQTHPLPFINTPHRLNLIQIDVF